jgi:hypothetical protein
LRIGSYRAITGTKNRERRQKSLSKISKASDDKVSGERNSRKLAVIGLSYRPKFCGFLEQQKERVLSRPAIGVTGLDRKLNMRDVNDREARCAMPSNQPRRVSVSDI